MNKVRTKYKLYINNCINKLIIFGKHAEDFLNLEFKQNSFEGRLVKIFWYIILGSSLSGINIYLINFLIKKEVSNIIYYIWYPIIIDFFILSIFTFIFIKKFKKIWIQLSLILIGLIVFYISIKYSIKERDKLIYLLKEYQILIAK